MPTNTKNKGVIATYEAGSPEWKVIEGICNRFVTPVKQKDGTPKIVEKTGQPQIRKEGADKVLQRIVSALLLNASEETLSNLASEAVDKKTTAGVEPKFKVSEFIHAIVSSRPVSGSDSEIDLTRLTDEQLAAELKRREEAKKAGKGTKDVSAV